MIPPELAEALARFNSGVALARDAYAKSQASPADRKAADDLRRARKRATDQARYRAHKKGTAA